jgi:hypothetical protein
MRDLDCLPTIKSKAHHRFTSPLRALPVAVWLRQTLIAVSNTRPVQQGQQTKMEQVYHYLTATKFKQRVDAAIEKFNDMRDDLDEERKFMTRQWAKRETVVEEQRCAATLPVGETGVARARAAGCGGVSPAQRGALKARVCTRLAFMSSCKFCFGAEDRGGSSGRHREVLDPCPREGGALSDYHANEQTEGLPLPYFLAVVDMSGGKAPTPERRGRRSRPIIRRDQIRVKLSSPSPSPARRRSVPRGAGPRRTTAPTTRSSSTIRPSPPPSTPTSLKTTMASMR